MGALNQLPVGFKRLLLLGSAQDDSYRIKAQLSPTGFVHTVQLIASLRNFAGVGDKRGDNSGIPATLAGSGDLCRGQSAQYGAGAVGLRFRHH